MNESDALAILVDAGLMGSGGALTEDSHIPSFNTFQNPEATEAIVDLIARSLLPMDVGAVVVWDGPDENVLAHVLARHLHTGWIRVSDDGGRLGYQGAIAGDARVVIFDDAFRTSQRVDGLVSLCESKGAQVVAIAALVSSRSAIVASRALGVPFVAAAGSRSVSSNK